MKIAGVIITFNPEIEKLEKNLKSITTQLKEIVVVDNGSTNIDALENKLKKWKNVKLVKLGKNLGIAEALNVGLKDIYNSGYKWAYTLDQDSFIPNDFIDKYEEIISKAGYKLKNVGAIGPNFDNFGTIVYSSKKEIDDVKCIITSACLTNIEAVKSVGWFDSKLFIDYVDMDICYKMFLKGYKILRLNKLIMIHMMGDSQIALPLIFKNMQAYSAFRRYYRARNGIVMFKRYLFKLPTVAILSAGDVVYTFLSIVIADIWGMKFKNIRWYIKGVFDGIRGK